MARVIIILFKSKSSYYNILSNLRSLFMPQMDGQWVRKKDLPTPIPDERTPSPPPQRDTSSSLLIEVLTELRDLTTFVGDHFDVMDFCITCLEDDMSFIQRCFDPSANS